MAPPWTIGRLVAWAAEYLAKHGADAPRLCGELLLARVLGLKRIDLYLRFEQPLTPEELAAFKALILRRRGREPLAYILGHKEFYGLDFKVGPGVLIPRPETEHLVEEALARLKDQTAPRVLDLCTGSGAVPLAILAHHPDATAVGVDISPAALNYARHNAAALGLADRVIWREGDLWDAVAPDGGFFELITANPPYVARHEYRDLPPEVRDYEPKQALLAGDDGLDLIRAIIAGAGAFLRPLGWLLIEIGAGQAARALELARHAEIFQEIATINDLAGIPRVLACQRGDWG
ncbi:MAG: peptide chain release factor N(5)-glutamine methyltransferase [Desulfarculus sp.]|nr:peptide chain release factor N(5)-glutamine methyltransferase [Desulfarculus sp.]